MVKPKVIKVDGRKAVVIHPPLTEKQRQDMLRWNDYRRWMDDLFAGVNLEKAGKR